MEYRKRKDKKPLTIMKRKFKDPQILGILKTAKKQGDTITRKDLKKASPENIIFEKRTVGNWYPRVVGTVSVSRPLGYFIPREYPEVIDTLNRHGVKISLVTEDLRIKVEFYKINRIITADLDYLPPKELKMTAGYSRRTIRKGDFYVSCGQAAANLIPVLLEPRSHYGLLRYRMYKLYLNKGDIYPFLRHIKNAELSLITYKNWQ
jgi:hypothetical protein